jgi:hypothetical protein
MRSSSDSPPRCLGAAPKTTCRSRSSRRSPRRRTATAPWSTTSSSRNGVSGWNRIVAQLWYKYGMARVRVSTTVDEALLTSARLARSELSDSALIDEALAAFLARHRAVEIDAAYAAYDSVPLDEADEWGDLASFRAAAGAS